MRSKRASVSRRASTRSGASSGSSATRKRGSPLWRVPRISPSPRSVRSTSASLKPSRSVAIASSRRRARLRRRVAEQDAERLVLAAAHAAAELVELREAVALGPLDDHHRRVRHVDPDLDHAGRDEHVGGAGGEPLHRPRLLARGHLPVQQLDLEVPQLAGGEPLRLLGGRLGLELLRALDQRADEVRLPALAQPLAHELVGARPPLLPHRPGLHRPATRRQLAQRRSRRGRRRRSATACAGSAWRSCAARAGAAGADGPLASSAARWRTPKRCCSSTTQTARRANSTSGSIRAWVPDDQRQLAAGQPAERVAPRTGAGRPGQERERDGRAREQAVERLRVLLGQRLGRRHQRGLVAALDRAQHRVDGDDGLAATRPRPSAVAASAGPTPGPRRSPRRPAAGRRSARTAATRSRHGRGRRAARGPRRAGSRRRARRRAASATWCRNSSSKASRSPGLRRGLGVVGEVDREERVAGLRQMQRRSAQLGRQRLDGVAHQAARLPDPLADAVGAEPVGDRMDRHEPDRCAGLARPACRRGAARAPSPGSPSGRACPRAAPASPAAAAPPARPG